jgi:hypothetical protein
MAYSYSDLDCEFLTRGQIAELKAGRFEIYLHESVADDFAVKFLDLGFKTEFVPNVELIDVDGRKNMGVLKSVS